MAPPLPAGFSRLHELLDPWVRQVPDAVALRDPHTTFTFGGLQQASIQAVDTLAALGVRAGDRVLVVGENCAALAVLLFALSRMDAWICIVNGRLSPREIDGIVEHAGPRRVLYTTHVSRDAVAHAERHRAEPVGFDGLPGLHAGPLNAGAEPEPTHAGADAQVAALIYTSGTSGAPKGVMLTHANIAFAALSVRTLRGIGPGDTVYGVLPMAHVVGLSTQLLGSLCSGASLLMAPRFTPESLAAALASGVTSFTGVPAMYSRLLEWLAREGRTLHAPALRVMGVAGAPLTDTLKAGVERALGVPLLNGYGMTEAAPTIAQVRAGAPRDDCAVGPPIPGIEVRIVRGHEGTGDGTGELWVRGPNVMKGYYRNAALTREVIDAQGWLNTGDLARLGPDGALHVVGRTKELIIRSGFNVYPVEVEQVLDAYPGVTQSAVVGRTTADNEEVIAYLEVPAGRTIDEQELQRYLRERLSPYKIPAEIHCLAQLPAAPTGKVLKGVLRKMAQQGAPAVRTTP
jgi:long-chain acyl-CoA synthetase